MNEDLLSRIQTDNFLVFHSKFVIRSQAYIVETTGFWSKKNLFIGISLDIAMFLLTMSTVLEGQNNFPERAHENS